MSTLANVQTSFNYLDMQAYVGITKHNGGFAATDKLLALCHIEQARQVLYVGSGIGVGPAYIARKYGCHVVGVDLSEKMIAWSCKRARQERVVEKTEFRVADVLDLPFEPGEFDLVMAESVLAFVEDKARALRECVRVTRPGGSVGLNESFWIRTPSPKMVEQVKSAIGPSIPILETWQTLWEACGFQEQVIQTYPINARQEIRERLEWVGWRWAVRAWVRILPLYLTNAGFRKAVKSVMDVPLEVFEAIHYGLFAGRKPEVEGQTG